MKLCTVCHLPIVDPPEQPINLRCRCSPSDVAFDPPPPLLDEVMKAQLADLADRK